MKHTTRPMTFRYKGLLATFDMLGWYCSDCQEGVYTGQDMQELDHQLELLKAQSANVLPSDYLEQRAGHGDRTRFEQTLAKVPAAPPDVHDTLEKVHMDPRQLFVDERHGGICVYCGGKPTTRDHVPSKVLLDEPFPPDLPVVEACEVCNNGFSLDEQYLACLVEAIMCGTADATLIRRDKIKRSATRGRSRERVGESRPQVSVKHLSPIFPGVAGNGGV